MRTLAVVTSISFLATLAACGTRLVVTNTNTPPRAMTPRSPESVQVFSTSPPPAPYVEVALIEARQQSEYSVDRENVVIDKLRKKAGEMGCDGLVMTGSADSVVGSSDDKSGYVRTLKGYKATCIVFTGEAPASKDAAPTGPRCIPNETRACIGPGGCSGGQACSADGASFTLCECAVTPGPAPSALPPATSASAKPL
jgi:hypothetical protein